MAGGREAPHVAAEFGDDRLGRAARDPGNRVEPGDAPRPAAAVQRRDVAIAGGDGLVEEFDVAQELGEQEAVMGGDAPGERLPEGRRACGAVRRWASSASSSGVPVAGDQRLEHRPRRHPEHVGDDTPRA